MADSQTLTQIVTGTCISFSFILAGNAITQSFMTIPALLANFPQPGSPHHIDRARLLGVQWPLCWSVGNVFFRPISTLSVIGYAFAAYKVRSVSQSNDYTSLAQRLVGGGADWRALAAAAVLQLVTVLHSALNMQPLNERLEGLVGAGEKELAGAEALARKWAKGNLIRLGTSVLGGFLAVWQFGKL